MAARKSSTAVEETVLNEVTEADLALFEASKPRKGRVATPSIFEAEYAESKAGNKVVKVPTTKDQVDAHRKQLAKAAKAAGDGAPTVVFDASQDALLFRWNAKQARTRRAK